MTSASDSKSFDGTHLTNDEITISGDGFKEGDGCTYDVTGSQYLVGHSDNTFTYTLNEGTNADDYDIRMVNGTLTVTDEDVAEMVPDLVVPFAVEDNEYELGEEVIISAICVNIYDNVDTISLTSPETVTLEQSVFGDVLGGETVMTEGTYTITETDIAAGGVSLEFTASFYESGLNVQTQVDITTVGAEAVLTIDVVDGAAGGPYSLGDEIEYTLTIGNEGNVTISNIEIVTSLGTTFNIASLAPGDSDEKQEYHIVTAADVANEGIAYTTETTADASVDPVDITEGDLWLDVQ